MPYFKGEVMIKMGPVGLGMPLNNRAFASMNMALGSVRVPEERERSRVGRQENPTEFILVLQF